MEEPSTELRFGGILLLIAALGSCNACNDTQELRKEVKELRQIVEAKK